MPESHERVKWKCRNNHVWEAAIRDRVERPKCRYCILEENNIKVKAPEIAKEWHRTKNLDLLPEMFTSNNNEKFWWQCSKNEEHEWSTSIYCRVHLKSGCPFCSKKQASKEYNLVTEYPDALKIWHPFLNYMTPYEVLPHSEKEVYWLKENGEITFERICNVTNRMNKLK